jgi:hypothetical protein
VKSAHDHVVHLASLDAQDLAGDFDSIPAREWDGKANAAWRKAADQAGLTDDERKTLHSVYLSALVARCAQIVDANFASHAEQDEQTCYFCARSVTTDRAVEEGWMPDFWFNDLESANSAVCPSCAPLHLTDLDADPVMKGSQNSSLEE